MLAASSVASANGKMTETDAEVGSVSRRESPSSTFRRVDLVDRSDLEPGCEDEEDTVRHEYEPGSFRMSTVEGAPRKTRYIDMNVGVQEAEL